MLGNNRKMVRVVIACAVFSVIFTILAATTMKTGRDTVAKLGASSMARLRNQQKHTTRPKRPADYTYYEVDDTSTANIELLYPCQTFDLHEHNGAMPKNVTDTRVLVTGGAGFIGSNLVDRLLELGYTVRVLDNLYTGFLRNVPLFNKGVEFVLGDILDPAIMAQAVQQVDYVYHLAAMSKVVPSLKDPDMARFCVESNALGTWSVLNATKAVMIGNNNVRGVKKVIYAASSTYYGNRPPPHQEDATPDFLTPYAASKYEGELQMQMFDRLFHIPTVSTRFFMVYGPRQPSTGAYAIVTGVFAKQAADGRPLTIEGDGSHYRDFIHVQDIVNGLILAQQHPDLRGEVINLGTGSAFSVQDVADLVSDDQVYVEARKNDLDGTLADTCRMKKLLHYRASKNFKQEMKYMVHQTIAGNVFTQSWLTPNHALAAPHLLPLGTPVFGWPQDLIDLGAILRALRKVVRDTDKSSRWISVIPFSLKRDEDLNAACNVLLNTVFSLVHFGGVFSYIIAASNDASVETCRVLNLPCYDARNTSLPELLSTLLSRSYDVHVAQAGNSYMRPVVEFVEILAGQNSDADVYQATPTGDFFVHKSHLINKKIAIRLDDAEVFSASKWPKGMESGAEVHYFDVPTICTGSLSSPRSAAKAVSFPSVLRGTDASESSSYCNSSRLYLGVGCPNLTMSAANIKIDLEKANLWHLSECKDQRHQRHCDIQQTVPKRWVQTQPNLEVMGSLCGRQSVRRRGVLDATGAVLP